ncbi:hypothetical protein IAT38_000418 [Cryptococcus sp. DSM 104549]
MSLRANMLRARLPATTSAFTRPLTSTSFARPLFPASGLNATQQYTRITPFASERGFVSSAVRRLEVSQPVGDGGMEEAPHSGINVDKSVRMDT